MAQSRIAKYIYWFVGLTFAAGMLFDISSHPAPAAQNPASSNESNAKFDTGLRGIDAQVMTGAANGMAGGAVAAFELPISDEEAKFQKDMRCFDEKECYGDRHFYHAIVTKYPAIARIKLPADPAYKNMDKEDMEPIKNDFYRAVYVAERIHLADGQSLFDFITKCAKGFSSADRAEFDRNGIEAMQFFPILRRLDTGVPVEMRILFDRSGPKVVARSPWFSTHIITDRDFLQQHGLQCWK